MVLQASGPGMSGLSPSQAGSKGLPQVSLNIGALLACLTWPLSL